MTVENCIRLLEAYKKQTENPVNEHGLALHGDERKHIEEQSKANYEMMKKHILSARKFKGHPILEELQKENPVEVKKDGKKSKR